ncbi:hypothetical protein PBY51_019451 [Eleginops maclovinus]|uniref:Uncharacterized protein n=1 Tax=Eleginops maclovinus TaxID=56733 RepID=A0AAN8AYM5_ELEMC|nr:hypothetical protein PBY51_019451 [Eleginops maclovinus]
MGSALSVTSGTDCRRSASQMGWTAARTSSSSLFLLHAPPQPSSSLPPSLFLPIGQSLGRLAQALHTGVTLQGSLMENLALFHSFSASRHAPPFTADTSSRSIDPDYTHL